MNSEQEKKIRRVEVSVKTKRESTKLIDFGAQNKYKPIIKSVVAEINDKFASAFASSSLTFFLAHCMSPTEDSL